MEYYSLVALQMPRPHEEDTTEQKKPWIVAAPSKRHRNFSFSISLLTDLKSFPLIQTREGVPLLQRLTISGLQLDRHPWLKSTCRCYPTSGMRLILGSVKKSASSVLRVENSDTILPSGPAWNQWRVSGKSVYCSPGFRQISLKTV